MTEGNEKSDVEACHYDGIETNNHDASTTRSERVRKPRRNPERTRHGAKNQHRHKNFCKWLLQTFPHLKDPRLQARDVKPTDEKRHVLDVAGGKGELAARLSICHRLNVVMVDPRKADVAKCFETRVLPKLPNKWQHRFQAQARDNPRFCQHVLDERFRQLEITFDEYNLQNSSELQEAVENACLLIGMHADGATEATLDTALRHAKPCVVVPCCVFPNLFSSRQIKEGANLVPVRSHEQFCRYLAQKDGRLVVETLPFEGRNTAIWFDPSQPMVTS